MEIKYGTASATYMSGMESGPYVVVTIEGDKSCAEVNISITAAQNLLQELEAILG